MKYPHAAEVWEHQEVVFTYIERHPLSLADCLLHTGDRVRRERKNGTGETEVYMQNV